MESTKYIRHTAIKVLIKTLLSGKFVEEDEQNQNYFQTILNEKLYRINVMGIVVQKETVGSITNLRIDDASGSIPVRFFEEHSSLSSIDIGSIIRIIGKVRMYNEEKYISPEICIKSTSSWLKVRKKELNVSNNEVQSEEIKNVEVPIVEKKEMEIVKEKESPVMEHKEEIVEQKIENDDIVEELPFQKVMNLIKELDTGNGVPIENIIEKSSLENTGTIIDKMLEKGDIFQNVPGKVKVL
ncbi:hypothetical protein HOL21_04505 [Candidatus Woesearchaeota archaeon]|jgi:RPA family protein|nr:hypothetical protein [Candidatus Woesearchaeota archaeon]MBT5397449.1 hypothetical protein [Candidatus Woesearchaeota archaeon]MBT6367751.1 hypothetical protein [Candidatus Woesearchaeota archaeon]MBT7762848.1 hypothetical protein [Candidatus Woesearchaeota archaeon]